MMKTILVDAVNTFVSPEGEIFTEMHELLEQYPHPKIILTNADDEQMKMFKLDQMPYPVFTLKHNPEKTDPTYFQIMLRELGLTAESVVYFEHNADAVKSARQNGITTLHYDKSAKDLGGLRRFIEKHT